MRRVPCRLEFYVELLTLLKPEERWTHQEAGKTGLLLLLPVKEEDREYLLFVPEESKETT